jgi:Domain of unknown function (DUF4260)
MLEGGMRRLLQLEATAIFAFAIFAYHQMGFAWLQFLVLFLVPDVSMLAFLHNPRTGAFFYNAVHHLFGPIVLFMASTLFALSAFGATGQSIAIVWIAHIGFDRMLGYGLKYQSGFKDTHLGKF